MDKRIKNLKFIKCNKHYGVLVNDTYEVWDDGIIYNYNKKDIPMYIFEFRDMIANLD